jgi:dTDP-4-dehydrorhamnose reductase
MTPPVGGPRVLIVGGGGTLGSALCRDLAGRGHRVVATTRTGGSGSARLDLSPDADSWPVPEGIDVAYLLAAVTSTDECRRHPQASRLVNVTATVRLASRLARAGLRVVFPSTNMVFDGSVPRPGPDLAPCPRTEYGRQKSEAEAAILALGPAACVVRFSKVLTPMAPLVTTWRRALLDGQTITPFSDLPLAPVSLARAVHVLAALADRPSNGILHVSATDDVSWADVARRLAAGWGVDPDLVQPTRVAAGGHRPEHLPRHATLDATATEAALGIPPADPREAIDALLTGPVAR